MTMFSVACYKFVRSVGKNTLIPAPSIDQRDDVKPLQLVIKSTKRRYIFFQKSKYLPTGFQITDVLTDQSPLQVKSDVETELSNYNTKVQVSLKGKFGADLANEIIDIELEADDKITVNIDFGKVMKKEVHVPDLMENLKRRNINLCHDYIQQIRKDSRKVLCVISGVAYLNQGGSIHRETTVDGNASVSTRLIRNAGPEADGKYDKGKDLGLSPGTPVGYSVHELNVDVDSGGIQLVLTEGSTGGFKKGISYDEVDGEPLHDTDVRNPLELFEPLMSLPMQQRSEFTKDLLCILDAPCDLPILADLLDKFEMKKESSEGQELKLVSPKDAIQRILGHAGIGFHNDKVVPPKSDTGMLPCLAEFFDAAAELDDDVLDWIVKCSPDVGLPLLTVLQDGIKGRAVTDSEVITKLREKPDGTHMTLLQELGFRITEDDIKAPIELPYYIDEIYWVMAALWGQN